MSRRGSGSRIYIGNLPEDIHEGEIEDIFRKYGRIRGIDIKSARSISGTAYAFLEYEDSRQAEYAVERKNGYRFGGNRLRVEFTGDRRPKRNFNKSHGPPKRSSYRVYVTGLPSMASWQDLKDHMRKAGPVGYANIERKVGVVEYETKEDMERAVRKLDRSEFKNIFHRCEIRVKYDREGGYRDDERSHSRGRKYRYSRSPSPRRTSYSSHSQYSRRRYSNDRSRSGHRSISPHRSEGSGRSDSRHRSHSNHPSNSRSPSYVNDKVEINEQKDDKNRSNSRSHTPARRSNSRSHTPARRSYSRSHSSRYENQRDFPQKTSQQQPSMANENGEEYRKDKSVSRSRSRSRTPENRSRSRRSSISQQG